MIKKFNSKSGSGRYAVELELTVTQDGIMGQLLGGEKPHLGAVVLSVPRSSLINKEKRSSNCWVLPLLGHKDDEIAKPVAEYIAVNTGHPVCLAAGIHIDSASEKDIKQLLANCIQAAEKFIEDFKNI